jgi:hypothetical protein
MQNSPLPTAHCPLTRRSRRGVSILEVLFAILVTTIGLFGAIAVFPVASSMARKGRISDAAAIAGRGAVHTFDTKGMRRPDMWVGWNQSWDSRVPLPSPPGPSFQSVPNIVLAQPNGTSFCIDPRFIAVNSGAAAQANPASIFPYVPPTAAVPGARMFRIGLTNGVPASLGGTLMNGLQANSVFILNEDPTTLRPGDGSVPGDRSMPAHGSVIQVDSDNDGTPDLFTSRNNDGHFSWMATLVPKHDLYTPQLTSAVLNAPQTIAPEQYVLSVVVFHDRPLVSFAVDPIPAASAIPDASDSMYNLAERPVGVNFADAGGTGFAGGETLLIWPPGPGQTLPNTAANYEQAQRMLKVRAGDWILLSGFAPRWVYSPTNPPVIANDVPVFRWYRITEADHEPEYHPAPEQHFAVAVSLAGQDWDLTLTNPQAVIVTGVVGVYEKTVRLEVGTGF